MVDSAAFSEIYCGTASYSFKNRGPLENFRKSRNYVFWHPITWFFVLFPIGLDYQRLLWKFSCSNSMFKVIFSVSLLLWVNVALSSHCSESETSVYLSYLVCHCSVEPLNLMQLLLLWKIDFVFINKHRKPFGLIRSEFHFKTVIGCFIFLLK